MRALDASLPQLKFPAEAGGLREAAAGLCCLQFGAYRVVLNAYIRWAQAIHRVKILQQKMGKTLGEETSLHRA